MTTPPSDTPSRAPASTSVSVLVSILNWNSAQITLNCVASVLAQPIPTGVQLELLVIDNGSRSDDVEHLIHGLSNKPVRVIKNLQNHGFAGGHNAAISEALQTNTDFIWLLNSDAIVNEQCLPCLLGLMASLPRCGAASPLIRRLGHPEIIDFAGAVHDWAKLDSIRPVELPAAKALAAQRPDDLWVVGTALLLRVEALRQVGMLDEGFFAYYEDDDICARLSQAGWTCQMAFEASIEHACFEGVIFDRPPYYFYLMARNAFQFWVRHTPTGRRRWLRLRLLETWLFMANRLHVEGQFARRDACLRGIYDGLRGITGKPRKIEESPWVMRLLCRARARSHRRHLLAWPH